MCQAVLEFGTTNSWHDEPEMCFALNFGAAVVFLLDLRGHGRMKDGHNLLEHHRALPVGYFWTFLLLVHKGALLVRVLRGQVHLVLAAGSAHGFWVFSAAVRGDNSSVSKHRIATGFWHWSLLQRCPS